MMSFTLEGSERLEEQTMNTVHVQKRHTLLYIIIPFLTLIISCGAQRMIINGSDRIVFFGDSITEQGEKPNGYVSLLRDTLVRQYPGIRVIGAGISGNRVPQLEERVDRDVLSRKPTAVVLYIGINDVWHFEKHGTGTPKDKYESGLHDLIVKIQQSRARVVLCTPSVIGERRNGGNKFDPMLDEYSAISRNVARKLGAKMCDLRQSFTEYLTTHNPENKESGILTVDGVHLNDAGNRFVADVLLKTLEQ
jgi:isoamyl acetate esterase